MVINHAIGKFSLLILNIAYFHFTLNPNELITAW